MEEIHTKPSIIQELCCY